MDLIEEIRRGLERPDKSKSELARRLGRHPNVVTYILKGDRQIKADEVDIIREYLELDGSVPIVGTVRAGDEAYFYGSGDDPSERAPGIPKASPMTVAVEIRGDSLGPAFNGWLAYYDDRRDPITTDMLNRLCVVGVSDGRVLIKIPRTARGKGLYHLHPNVPGEVITDARIEWAARVIDLRPKSTK